MKLDKNKFSKINDVFDKAFIEQLAEFDVTEEMEVEIVLGKKFKTESVKFSG
jgi:hypothetical protein